MPERWLARVRRLPILHRRCGRDLSRRAICAARRQRLIARGKSALRRASPGSGLGGAAPIGLTVEELQKRSAL